MPQPGFTTSFTQSVHKTAYLAISPLNPTISASDKNILITAGGTGIGFATANAFASAGAAHLILLSRRESVLQAAATKLTNSHPKIKVHIYAVSVTDEAALAKVFGDVKAKIGRLDIVVSSHANPQPYCPALQTSLSHTRETFETVVLGGINLLNAFLTHFPPSPEEQKVFINVSSAAAHMLLPGQFSYCTAKAAFLTTLQAYDAEYAAQGLRVHSFHPGGIYTDGVRNSGVPESVYDWDDESLPAGFTVWLASSQAKFLSGRMLWASWDVEEMMARSEEFEKDPELLKMGLMVGGHKTFDLLKSSYKGP